MFVIRQTRIDDLPILLKLARMVHFINLPADKDIITGKIERSEQSFGGKIGNPTQGLYMFAIEDDETGNLLGTSQIIAKMGTPESPNTYFEVGTREFYADDLRQGCRHTTLKLGAERDGGSEVGGLILQPSFRGHPSRLGKSLSLIRFHYIGLHRERFADELIAEMMAPLTHEGTNALWEYLGRRFINLTYDEADRLSTKSKAFILDLMPREEIYVSLLPPEARIIIGQVGKDTEPAKAMLEKMGFEYRNHIDPFDGGPHLHARTGDVTVIRDTRRVTLKGACGKGQAGGEALVSFESESGFRALRTELALSGGSGDILLPKPVMAALQAEPGATVGLTLLAHPNRGTKRGGSAKGKGNAGSKRTKGRKAVGQGA